MRALKTFARPILARLVGGPAMFLLTAAHASTVTGIIDALSRSCPGAGA